VKLTISQKLTGFYKKKKNQKEKLPPPVVPVRRPQGED
jgi:hypothetical protein